MKKGSWFARGGGEQTRPGKLGSEKVLFQNGFTRGQGVLLSKCKNGGFQGNGKGVGRASIGRKNSEDSTGDGVPLRSSKNGKEGEGCQGDDGPNLVSRPIARGGKEKRGGRKKSKKQEKGGKEGEPKDDHGWPSDQVK